MKHRRRLFLALAFLLQVSGLLLIPSVRWPLHGWMRGEAFYQRMPTSWWEKEIEESYLPFLCTLNGDAVTGPTEWYLDTRPPYLESVLEQLKTNQQGNLGSEFVTRGPLLFGDLEALPVLLALVRGDSAKVRRVAVSGLLSLCKEHGKGNAEIMAALLAATEDPNEEVRRDARLILKQLDSDKPRRASIE